MFKKLPIALFGLLCAQPLFGQLNPKNIPFLQPNGDTIRFAHIGGTDAPQYSQLDLNNDQKQDLLLYDRVGQIALPFLNVGGANQIRYEFAPQYMDVFPQGTINLMLARDYDNDGIADLFHFYQPANAAAGLSVMKGSYDSNNRLQFTRIVETLSYDAGGFTDQLFIANPDVPIIEDIDNDGDLDVAAFTLDFSGNVMFYKNLSIERGFNTDSLIYKLEHNCMGMFSKNTISVTNSVITSGRTDSCGGNQFWRGPRHGASGSLSMFDYDGDGVKEIFLSDAGINAMNKLSTVVINDTLVVMSQDTQFPIGGTVDLFSYPVAYFLDINNDGRKDMLVGNNEGALGPVGYVTDSTTHIYLNNGSAQVADFQLLSKDFIYNQTVDVGNEAHPAFADVNGDGLLDLVVGNRIAMRSNGNRSSSLHLFLNVGSRNRPVFQRSNSNFANIASLGKNSPYPSFGDIDGDGDLDLMVGFEDGTLSLLVNNAGVGQSMAFAAPSPNYNNYNVGAAASPQLFDLDKDGDLDLIVGENSGVINYFENTGSPASANFGTGPSIPFLGQVSLNANGSIRSVPFFALNPNGETELYLGHQQGNLIKMGNIDNNLNGKFDSLDTHYLNHYSGRFAALAMADIDGDSIADAVIGNSRGGLNFYTSRVDSTETNIIDWSADLDRSALYPNPVSGGTVNLAYSSQCPTRPICNIYTSVGQLVQTNRLEANETNYQVNVSNLKPGIYMLQFIRGSVAKTYRIIIR